MRTCAAVVLGMMAMIAMGGCQQSPPVADSSLDRTGLAELNTELGVQYMQNREYEVALEKLNKALQLDPEYVDAYNTLGLLRAVLGQDDKAEAAFKQALRIDPTNSSALNNYGQFLCRRERYEEGEKLFLKAIENPLYKHPEAAYSNAGTCVADTGDLDKAETYFRKALGIDDKLAPALYQMAELSFKFERYLPARGYLQRYVEVAGHSPRSLWLGVQIERALGNKDDAASYALQLEKNFPDSLQTKLLFESKSQ